MLNSKNTSMAVLQNHKQSSSLPPPSTTASNQEKPPKHNEKLLRKKSSISQSQTAKSMVLYAHPMNSETNKRKRASVKSLYSVSQAQSSVLERARKVEANLNPKFPIFVKLMLRSHVTLGFWLGLPRKFCSEHLPKEDAPIFLEDESGEEFETRYLVDKMGLSGGWRGFSIAHKIEEGDVVIYQLVTRSKFKVYIVRSNGSDEMDSALGLMSLDTSTVRMDGEEIIPFEREETEYLEPIPGECAITFDTKSGPDQSENESEDLGVEFLDELTLAESDGTFEEVKCMENFKVLVNGVIINSELKHVLTKYYELCRSQNAFLHEHLLHGLNCKLVAGAISETVNIADAIRACKITTSKDNFSTWGTTLKVFEVLGMNMGFLRTRLNQLGSLALKSKRFKEARFEKFQAEEEMRKLEAKLLEVKQSISKLDSEIEALNTSSEKFEDMFEEVAKAPW